MTRKSENIVSYSLDELVAKQKRGDTRTDWKKAATAPMPDGSDPDDGMTGDWMISELPERQSKTHASLRIDSDVLDWFKAQGRGYQTRINAVLRSYFLHHARR